ncbi:hypothetical protein K439DRAFT_447684 [Ramaria rubella]|nr:hypothetical protein K439DRAFT_447684 [Ramaria rubella]
MLTAGLNGLDCWLGSTTKRRLLVKLPTRHPSGTDTVIDESNGGLALHAKSNIHRSCWLDYDQPRSQARRQHHGL